MKLYKGDIITFPIGFSGLCTGRVLANTSDKKATVFVKDFVFRGKRAYWSKSPSYLIPAIGFNWDLVRHCYDDIKVIKKSPLRKTEKNFLQRLVYCVTNIMPE